MANTLDEDKLAGNAEDSHNPGNDWYKPGKPLNEEESATLAAMEAALASGDTESARQLQDELTSSGASSRAREALQQSEQNPNAPAAPLAGAPAKQTKGFWGRFRNGFRRYSATGGIVIVMGGGAGITGGLLAPGSILVTLDKALTNDASDFVRTNIVFHRAYISLLFKATGGTPQTETEKKLTSMSEEHKSRWEKAGFKLELDPDGKIASMRFPNGTTVTTGEGFLNYAENTQEGRRATSRVFELRAGFTEGQRFRDVLNKYKITKSNRLKASTDRNEEKRRVAMNQSFEENTGLKHLESDEDRLNDWKSKTTESSDIKTKVNRAANAMARAANINIPLATACSVYNTVRLTSATIRAKWIYDLISFAYPFVRAGAQIIDQGDIEPEVVDYMASRLTWYDPNKTGLDGKPNPKYNLNALDSPGLQMAIYGDFKKLAEWAKHYTTWYDTAGIALNSIVNTAADVVGGKENAKTICSFSKDISTGSLALCLTGPWALGICSVGAVITPEVIEKAMLLLIPILADDAIKALSRIDLSSATRGVDAGHAIAAGINLLMSDVSLSSGMIPAAGPDAAKKVFEFAQATEQPYHTYTTQIAMDEAKEKPFDIHNQYSFVGQLAAAFNSYGPGDGTIFSRIANIFGMTRAPLMSLSGSAQAMFYQPQNMTLTQSSTLNRLSKCEDPLMRELEAACDWAGEPAYYTSSNVIDAMNPLSSTAGTVLSKVRSSIQYMHSTKQIDRTSREVEKDSDFEKWLTYCTDKRADPIGTSSEPIADDKGNWHDGERCMRKDPKDYTMLDNFLIYYQFCYVQYASKERKTDCVTDKPEEGGGSGAAANVNSNCGDGTTESIYECALQFDPYRYELGAGHDEYGKVSWYEGFKSNPPAPGAIAFDCSSLVMAAMVAAFGIDFGNQVAPGTYQSDKANWQSVPKDQAKRGDLIVQSGHVEIIKDNDVAGQRFTTFGAHTSSVPLEKQIGESGFSYGDVDVGTFRYIGSGVKGGGGELNV